MKKLADSVKVQKFRLSLRASAHTGVAIRTPRARSKRERIATPARGLVRNDSLRFMPPGRPTVRAVIVLAVLCLSLCGCSAQSREIDTGMALRSKLLKAQTITFDADITADYGDKLYTFSMACQGDSQGNIAFTVIAPDTIAGISGSLDAQGGKLTFDETALAFDLLADGQLSPVSAPWILLKTLRSGCITSACTEEGQTRLSMDDSYRDDALHLDIWLDAENLPARADILYGERRILSLGLKNVEIS